MANLNSHKLGILLLAIWILSLILIFRLSWEKQPEPETFIEQGKTMFQEAYDLADYCGELTELSELLDCIDELKIRQKAIENFWIIQEI